MCSPGTSGLFSVIVVKRGHLMSRRLPHELSVAESLAGVSFFLKLSVFSALTGFFQVRQMLKGLKRCSTILDVRRPITVDAK